MTIEELIDFVQMDLTFSCSIPKVLKDEEIRRLAVDIAAPWFFQNYQYAVEKAYYWVPRTIMLTEEFTKYKYLQLPCEVQSVTWIYEMRNSSMFNLGINSPNLSMNMGVTNQPYLSSFVTSIGELATYKVIVDGFADTLNMLSKYTVKYDYNFNNQRLQLLTSINTDLILEIYAQIALEDLFNNQLFKRYSIALAKQQMGRLLSRFGFSLPGGITINGEALKSEGDAEKTAVEEEVKKNNNNSGFFFMTRR
jgi:hypothetical protein